MTARHLPAVAGSLPLLLPVASLAGTAAPTEPAPPPLTATARSAHSFRISAGWMYRRLGNVDFQTGSRSHAVRLPSLFGSASLQVPAIGAADGAADRLYADGFVRIDQGTATDGATADWGYKHSEQIQGEFLDFHAQGSRSETAASSASEPAEAWSFDAEGGAPVVTFDWSHDLGPRWAIGAQAQWSFLGLDAGHEGTNFRATQSGAQYTVGITDRYALDGMIPPAAPYQGSSIGNGPLLGAMPTSRNRSESLQSAGQTLFFNDVRESLDVEIHTLSLGPTLRARFGTADIQLAIGIAATIAEWDASHHEVLRVSRDGGRATQVQSWKAQTSDTDLLPGFFIQGAMSLPLTERVSVTAFGRYDWSESLGGSVGPSSFSVDLGGWSVGALVGVSF